VADWDALLDAVEALPLGSTTELDIQRRGQRLRLSIRVEAGRD
jgi:S1-C subfamily serine protease